MLAPAYAQLGALRSTWGCQGAVHNIPQTDFTYVHCLAFPCLQVKRMTHVSILTTALTLFCSAGTSNTMPGYLPTERDKPSRQNHNAFVDLWDYESRSSPSGHNFVAFHTQAQRERDGTAAFFFFFFKHLQPHSVRTYPANRHKCFLYCLFSFCDGSAASIILLKACPLSQR